MELLKDYEVTIQSNLGKVNVVAGSLSRKVISMGSLAYLTVSKKPLAKKIHTLECKFMKLGISKRGGVLDSIEAKTTFMDDIKAKNFLGWKFEEPKDKMVNVKSQEPRMLWLVYLALRKEYVFLE